MSPPPVVPGILEKLEPHLERLVIAWTTQPEEDRQPTLPLTPAGKVNVRQLVRDLGLKETLEQHFYRKSELAGPVNAVAAEQGVRPIGSQVQEDETYAGVRAIVGRNAQELSDLRRALSEREALIGSLRAEIMRLNARLGLLEETGMVIRGADGA
jgi:hypothetical protein